MPPAEEVKFPLSWHVLPARENGHTTSGPGRLASSGAASFFWTKDGCTLKLHTASLCVSVGAKVTAFASEVQMIVRRPVPLMLATCS